MLMVNIAHLTDCGKALNMDSPYLTGGHPYQCMAILFSHELCTITGAPYQLPSFTSVKLDIMDRCACRDGFYGQRIAYLYLGIATCHNGVAHLKAERCDYVSLLPIGVVNEGDSR